LHTPKGEFSPKGPLYTPRDGDTFPQKKAPPQKGPPEREKNRKFETGPTKPLPRFLKGQRGHQNPQTTLGNYQPQSLIV